MLNNQVFELIKRNQIIEATEEMLYSLDRERYLNEIYNLYSSRI